MSLPELPIQYPDDAVWQRGHLSEEVLKPQLAYWKKQLSGAPPLLALPTDRPRPALQSFKGARLSRMLDSALLDAVKTVRPSRSRNAIHDSARGVFGAAVKVLPLR